MDKLNMKKKHGRSFLNRSKFQNKSSSSNQNDHSSKDVNHFKEKPIDVKNGYFGTQSLKDPINIIDNWLEMDNKDQLLLSFFDDSTNKSRESIYLNRFMDWKSNDPDFFVDFYGKLLLLFSHKDIVYSIFEDKVNKLYRLIVNSNFCLKISPHLPIILTKYDGGSVIIVMKECIYRFRDSILSIRNLCQMIDNAIQNWKIPVDQSFRNDFSKFIIEIGHRYKDYELNIFNFMSFETNKPRSSIHINNEVNEIIYDHTNPIPTLDEILNNIHPFEVRNNKVGEVYENRDEYLDTHWRFLRSDSLDSIRSGIHEYRYLIAKNTPMTKNILKDCYIYHNVRFSSVSLPSSKYQPLTLKFSFSLYSKVNWGRSKRFLPQSLVALSNNHFKTIIWGTVGYNREQLKDNLVSITIDPESLSDFDITSKNYVILESKTYWLSSVHILERLKSFKNRLPFEDYLLNRKRNVDPPYIGKMMYNLSPVSKDPNSSSLLNQYLKNDKYPGDLTYLDESQWNALKHILTRKISIIQGPPGTGKTFMGHKAIEIILKSSILNGPVLCVCYTNHALDQFLEGIIKFEKNVIRIGGRSKSDVLKEYTLKRRGNLTKQHKANIYILTREKDEILKRLQDHEEVFNNKNLILRRFYELIKVNSIPDSDRELGYKKFMKKWLGNTHQGKKLANKLENLTLDVDSNEEDAEYDDQDISNEIENRILEIQDVDEKKEMKFDITLIEEESNYSNERICDILSKVNNIYSISEEVRCNLFDSFRTNYKKEILLDVMDLVTKHQNIVQSLKELYNSLDAYEMKNTKVIGMTTTGASMLTKVLNRVQPELLIIEEAGELLESQTISCLFDSMKHVILIGDHQQLRPNVNVYNYVHRGMDISLFERLIKSEFEYITLQQQHRMHPSISILMRPIYPNLYNAESTISNNAVRGCSKRVFFFKHSWKEKSLTNEESLSKKNIEESKFIANLAKYFIQQGYESNQITILSMYQGQVHEIRQNLRNHKNQSISGAKASKIMTTTVDNFQGQENDIIILSLVRSNEKGDIGFVKIPNRICVSLSRARSGLYIIGSEDTIRHAYEKQKDNKDTLWLSILNILKESGQIGDEMVFYCQNHPESISRVKVSSDFDKIPNGCCTKPCNQRMDCGHKCRSTCHVFPHSELKCYEVCSRYYQCGLHRCEKNCYEECGTCPVKVKRTLGCGHEVMAECGLELNKIQCTVICNKLLPCGHPCKKKCGQPCQNFCKTMIPVLQSCGHTIKTHCHKQNTPKKHKCEHKMECGHICVNDCSECKGNHRCDKPCSRYLICNHKCGSKCSEPCGPCKKKCIVECYHSKCSLECGKRCILCMENCDWKCEHYSCQLKCYEVCTRPVCNEPCKILRECKHPCIGLCGEICPKVCKICHPKVQVYGSLCMMTCIEEEDDDERFIVLEDCGHIVSVTAMDLYIKSRLLSNNIRILDCPRCMTPLYKTKRYRPQMNQMLIDIDHIKSKFEVDNIKDLINKKNWKLAENAMNSRITSLEKAKLKLTDEDLLLIGIIAFGQNDEGKAETYIDKALAINPENVIAKSLKDQITNKTKEMVLMAMEKEIRKGGWYKCPNGHIYAIGECGGATETSKCADCGELIGGTNHSLIESNSHAGEMDGSKYPAYGEEANMANFDLNDLY